MERRRRLGLELCVLKKKEGTSYHGAEREIRKEEEERKKGG